jgi:hypothetical protein
MIWTPLDLLILRDRDKRINEEEAECAEIISGKPLGLLNSQKG